MATIFRGFSTVDNIRAPYSLYDDYLVKRELLNELSGIIKFNPKAIKEIRIKPHKLLFSKEYLSS